MNRSAKDGEWSSLHYAGEGVWVPPRRTTVCAGDTVGKTDVCPREAWYRPTGKVGLRWCDTRRRKGGPTGKTKGDLEPPEGRCGYKRARSSSRCGARSRSRAYYSGTRDQHKPLDHSPELWRPRHPKGTGAGEGPVLRCAEEMPQPGE